jgi:hypothetical protein
VYPVHRTGSMLYHSSYAGNYRTQLHKLHTWEEHLAGVIDEMQPAWDARFDTDNRLPHVFDEKVTGSIDTFPIIIQRPSDGTQSQYYNGKYKHHIVKVVTTCNKSCCVLSIYVTKTNKSCCLLLSVGASHLQSHGHHHLVQRPAPGCPA